jgi:hypothetical protein
MLAASDWSSLEIAKLGVALLTPLLLVGLGFLVNRAGRRLEEAQWAGRKLIERRLELHREMAPRLNDLLCFFTCKGHFREIDPPEAITRKRELDKIFFTNEQLFSEEFRLRYELFIEVLFRHFTGFGSNAKLRTDLALLKRERGAESRWDENWDKHFVEPAGASSRQDVDAAYNWLMSCFADDLGVRR